MGYALRPLTKQRRLPRHRRQRPANYRREWWQSAPQSVVVTMSGGLVMGGRFTVSTGIYGPGAAGFVAPGTSRRVGL